MAATTTRSTPRAPPASSFPLPRTPASPVSPRRTSSPRTWERKVRRKHRHTGLKVFITILVVLLIAVGGCAFAYWRGFGWPTQQTVVESLFKAKTDKTGIDAYLANSLSDSQRQAIDDSLPSGASVTISGSDQSMGASTVYATADLSQGGTVSYTIELVRDGISWKVSSVQTSFSSQSDGQGN